MPLAYSFRRWISIITFGLIAIMAFDAMAQHEPRPKRKGRKYKVRIDSAPQRAAIYLDDKKYGIVGYTPWEGRLEKGDWKIILDLEGYENAERVVRVTRKRLTQEFFLPLVKKDVPGTVEVSPAADQNAFGAEVWIDGQLMGTIPHLANVPEGRHLVEIKKPEFQEFSQWVNVKEGQKVTIAPVLKALKKAPETGSILIDADVQDAEVYIDGKKHSDTTPTLISGVPEGAHVIEVRKEPAMPWKQTVMVKAGETSKVSAGLQATAGGPGGSVRVLSNVSGADVLVDGTKVGQSPVDVKDLRPGEHVIEVRADGYTPKKKRVTVSAGSATVMEFDLMADAGGDSATVKVVSPVPGATVSIDGETLGEAPQQKSLAPGEHFVLVEKEGFKPFQAPVRLEPGQSVTVTAELREAGSVRVLSTPPGANVLLDGEIKGQTPVTLDDVDVGEHVIAIQSEDYYRFEKNVNVVGGERQVVNATLKKIDIGPTAAELEREQRAMTSFGARTLRKGRATIDAAVGYPYLLYGRLTVGAANIGDFGFDAGVTLRSFFSRTELAVHGRVQLIDAEPFAMGIFGQIGGGSNLFDTSGRNAFLLDAGGMISLSALGSLTVTGRAYFNMWSDRHCPALNAAGDDFEDRKLDPIDVCVDALEGTLNSETMAQVVDVLGSVENLFERDHGVRLMTSLAIEIAVRQHWNIWLLVEGAPFQEERAAYTDVIHAPMIEDDVATYVHGGATYKF